MKFLTFSFDNYKFKDSFCFLGASLEKLVKLQIAIMALVCSGALWGGRMEWRMDDQAEAMKEMRPKAPRFMNA